jgi:superkiller protein 3
MFFFSLLFQGNSKKAVSISQSAIFAEPSLSSARLQLASLSLKQGEHTSALAVLPSQHEDSLEDERKSLSLRAVAESANEEEDASRLAQRAIILTPWESKNWEALAYVRGGRIIK